VVRRKAAESVHTRCVAQRFLPAPTHSLNKSTKVRRCRFRLRRKSRIVPCCVPSLPTSGRCAPTGIRRPRAGPVRRVLVRRRAGSRRGIRESPVAAGKDAAPPQPRPRTPARQKGARRFSWGKHGQDGIPCDERPSKPPG